MKPTGNKPGRPVVGDHIRFWAKVRGCDTDGCWEWTGPFFQGKKYGQFGCGPRTSRKNRASHRYAFEEKNGPIPSGMCVCHRCDNPSCVRPDHLFLGTHSDNTHDMIAKRRGAHGERHTSAKLTESQVAGIRQRRADGEKLSTMADEYGVSVGLISHICSGRNWKHIPLVTT